ncbi:apicoplast pyruvate carrier 1-like isoform X2 [Ptychodera flava]|uniref:apicoplast pyruvate carrier 1-like isoform X2 n=1 Tax=Ptychodera flava TaxID=63121 RepID=UPI00396A5F3B
MAGTNTGDISGLTPFESNGDTNCVCMPLERWIKSCSTNADSKRLIEDGKDTNQQQRRALLLHSAALNMSNIGLRRKKWRGMVAVVGGILIHLTLGTTFGNLSPYLVSYIRERSKPSDLTYEMATWIFATANIMQGSFMYFGGLLGKKLGTRVTVLIGSSIQSAGVLLTYFSLRHSFYLVIITYGVMYGLGVALAYGAAITCGLRWFPKHKGVITGLIVAGYGGGAFIFNQVQTAYINPQNLSPTERLSGKYFDQKEILDRTPTCFLLLGGCYIVLQLIGTLFVVDPPEKEILSQQSENQSKRLFPLPDEEREEIDSRCSGSNLNSSAVVRTRAFWTMWFTFVLNKETEIFVTSLYKVFGQNFIHDDHFLSRVGSFASVFDCLGRVFWGYLGDRFSFRDAMLGLCTFSVAFLVTFIATEEAGKAMFAIWVCAIFFTLSGNFALFPMATARSFGEENAGPNYGILYTAVMASSVSGTLFISTLSKRIGWIGLFNFCAGCSLAGGIIIFTFNMKTPKGKDI